MDFISSVSHSNIQNEFPDDQPPATSYPDPQKPGQQAPMNPTPDVPGTDAPGVDTGSKLEPQEQEGDEKDVPVVGPDEE